MAIRRLGSGGFLWYYVHKTNEEVFGMDETRKPYPDGLREDEEYGIQLLYAPPEFWEEERKKQPQQKKRRLPTDEPPIHAVYAAPDFFKKR